MKQRSNYSSLTETKISNQKLVNCGLERYDIFMSQRTAQKHKWFTNAATEGT